MKDNNYNNNWPFKKINYLLFIIGVAIIALGYIVMGLGEVNSFQSVRIAPFILFIGYVIIIPISIFYKK